MKFYIASGLQNKENVKYVAAQLKACGFTHTYDWTVNNRAESYEELKKVGEAERTGVLNADFLIALLPGGKGTHVELGMALAQNKRVYLYSPNEDINNLTITSTFYFLEEVRPFIGHISDFINLVIKQETELIVH
ncbi:nucleoside 2-deoxyribosyltransferase [Bacillus sp. CGMCC 1.16607]|uniref:nucleoside 2-deoxyribosyltransferase n=1 Tax=Bacillus sp. CGMCC 1.16607 TaxID=3351842 RepID=UPI00363A19C7